MKLRLSMKKTAATMVAAGMFVGAMSSAAPAVAQPKWPTKLDRKAVIERAKTWTSKRVPYSQTGYKKGYRRDCSGFVAMAWNIPENLVTWNVPTVSRPISQRQLKPGDVLLNTKVNRHVVIFEKWANKSKTKYYVLEQTGQSGVDSAIRRVVPYPYRINGSLYKAYRYVGEKAYYENVPRSARQPVKGFKLIDAKKPAKAEKTTRNAAKAKALPKTVAPKPEAKAPAAKTPTQTSAPTSAPAPRVPETAATPAANAGFLGTVVGWILGD